MLAKIIHADLALVLACYQQQMLKTQRFDR